MWGWVDGLDRQLFVELNQNITHPALDALIPVVTNLHHNFWFQWVAAPFFLIVLIWRYRMRTVAWMFSLAITIGVTDSISYNVLKATAQRARPHQVADLHSVVRVPYAPKSYSMPSNHSLNSFALATVSSWFAPKFTLFFYAFAALAGYSRVYVGVHYPGDVLAGAVIGFAMAWILRWIFFRRLGFFRRALKM